MSSSDRWLADEVVKALTPLTIGVSSAPAFRGLLQDLGWDAAFDDTEFGDLTSGILSTLEGAVAAVQALAETGGEEPGDQIAALLDAGAAVFAAVEQLREVGDGGWDLQHLPDPLDDADFWVEFALDLPEYLLIHYLRAEAPVVYGLFRAFGVIAPVAEPRGADDDRERLVWDHLVELLGSPSERLATEYDWGGDFRHVTALANLQLVLGPLAERVRRADLPEPLVDHFYDGRPPPPDVRQLETTLVSGTTADGVASVDAGLLLAPVPEADPGPGSALEPTGLFFGSWALGAAATEVELGSGWVLSVAAGLDAAGAFGFALRPSGATFESAEPFVSGELRIERRPPAPWLLFGTADGTRVELQGAAAAIGASGAASDPELYLEAGATNGGLGITLQLGDADSFVRGLLGDGLQAAIEGSLRWSSRSGLTFEGSAEAEGTFDLNLTVGPVTLYWLRLLLGASGGSDSAPGVGLAATMAAGAAIGPFELAVEGVGIEIRLEQAESGRGSLGAADLRLRLIPPDGVGAAINAPGVSGGGYLYIDADAGKYAGILSIEVMEIGITAIGIITTTLPDGSSGWSMFLSLSATFSAIQLGFGFTLEGVGGMVGVHRTIDTAALQSGLKSGVLDSLLFPDDPIANAPRILADMEAVFPAAAGRFVFGPVGKIGWGTPTLITGEVGLIIEVPAPLMIVFLGSIETVLPDEEVRLLELHCDILGIIDIAAGTVSIDATLRDSWLAGFVLQGDLAFRAAFLDRPGFLASVGGFHPAFEPPSDMPTMARLALSLDTGDALHMGFECYAAVTSNSIQFGAAFSFWAKALGMVAEGGAEFDALIQLDPFRLATHVGFHVSIRAGSWDLLAVHLSLDLVGPNPWHAVGVATFKVLGISKDFRVEAEIGRALTQADVAPVRVAAQVDAALRSADAWRVVEPATSAVLLHGDASETRAHPAGRLEVVQTVAPLERTLEHFGRSPIEGETRLELSDARVGGQPVTSESVDDWFAPAQFFDLSEAEKLSAPSFEEMPAGLRLGDDGVEAGPGREATLGYEEIIRDPQGEGEADRSGNVWKAPTDWIAETLRERISPKPMPAFALHAEGWVVADGTTGEVDLDTPADGVSWSRAREIRRELGGGVLLPTHEAELLR